MREMEDMNVSFWWVSIQSQISGNEVDTQNSKTCDTHHPSVENMENPRGYATADLYEKHPTKPNLWRV